MGATTFSITALITMGIFVVVSMNESQHSSFKCHSAECRYAKSNYSESNGAKFALRIENVVDLLVNTFLTLRIFFLNDVALLKFNI